MLKKMIIFFGLLLMISDLSATELTIRVKSIELGDYCWLRAAVVQKTKSSDITFVVNAADDKLCVAADSAAATKLWHGKKLKVSISPFKICEHLPPCEKNDKMLEVKAITDYKILSD